MFPTTWYAPTFYSRTYWPRPGVRIHDALLTDFVMVTAEQPPTIDAEPALAVVAADSLITIDADAGAFVPVDADRFVLVETR